MATKYRNIVGTGFPDFVKQQIENRKKVANKPSRSAKELQWLTNRTGFVRLSSAAKLKPEGAALTKQEIQEISQGALSATQNIIPVGTALSNTVQPTTTGISVDPVIAKNNALANEAKLQEERYNQEYADRVAIEDDKLYVTDLAKKHVLQGGTLSSREDGKLNPKNTFDTTYTRGGEDDLGYKPMPGILNLSVGTAGKWQTLMQAEVEFVCYTLDQLDIMSKLYMSLGVHVFLEWGHTPFINPSGEIELTGIQPIDFFNPSSTYFTDPKALLKEVTRRKEEYGGNYGGLFGRVYNFDWVANTDGSYTCKSYIMGPGGMAESLRINKSSRRDFSYFDGDNESEKYSSDVENALHTIKKFLQKTDLGGNVTTKSGGVAGLGGGSGGETIIKFDKIGPEDFFTSQFTIKGVEQKYGDLLNRIYNSSTYPGPKFQTTISGVNALFQDKNNYGVYGNAWQIISGIVNTGNSFGVLEVDGLKSLQQNPDLFNAYYSLRTTGDDPTKKSGYITFGHLLVLIQHLGIFVEGDNNYILKNSNKKSPANSAIYLDYHPDNTLMKTGPLEASIDPAKCLIPWNINTTPQKSNARQAIDAYYFPLSPDKSAPYSFEDEDKEPNVRKNFANDFGKTRNLVNPKYSNFKNEEGNGRLMNVLINIDYAIESLQTLAQSDSQNEVNLIEFLYRILDGINLSLGKVNNFRVFFDDNSHTLRIIDENLLINIKKDENLLEIPNFGLQSITYDYSLSSKISPKLASQIVIASQAADRGTLKEFPDDVLTYNKLNGGVRDRYAELLLPAVPKVNVENELEEVKATQKLFDHIFKVYNMQNLVDEDVNGIKNLYYDLQGVESKYYTYKATTLVIPIEFSITLDGIEGILPYNAFIIPDNRLPARYRGKFAFGVFNINHEFGSNQWTTTLRGQIIPRNHEAYSDDRPNNEEATKELEIPINLSTGDGSLDPEFTPQGQIEYTTTEITPKPKGQAAPGDVSTQGDGGIAVGLNQLEGNRSINLAQLNPRPDTNIPGLIEFIKPREGLVKTAYPDITNRTEGQGFIQAANTFQETFTIEGVKNETRTVRAGQWYRWTIGYGSHTITAPNGQFRYVKQGDVITAEDAERDLERNMQEVYIPIARDACKANGVDFDNLPNRVKIVFVDFTYNYDGHLYNNVINSYKNGGKQGLINELKRRMSLPGQVPTRRQEEIDLLQGG